MAPQANEAATGSNGMSAWPLAVCAVLAGFGLQSGRATPHPHPPDINPLPLPPGSGPGNTFLRHARSSNEAGEAGRGVSQQPVWSLLQGYVAHADARHASSATTAAASTSKSSAAVADLTPSTAPLVALAGPLAFFGLSGPSPTFLLGVSELRALEKCAVDSWGTLSPTQLAVIVWALAWFGHDISPELLDMVKAALASGSTARDAPADAGALSALGFGGPPTAAQARLPAADMAVLLWSLAMQVRPFTCVLCRARACANAVEAVGDGALEQRQSKVCTTATA